MRMAPAEPVRARIFRKRAKESSTKLPPKPMSVPSGSHAMTRAAATSSAIASQLIMGAEDSPRKAPSINSAIAPKASTISGSAGSIAERPIASFMGISPQRQRGRMRRVERVCVAIDELRHGGGRKVDHRLREDAEQDRQDRQRNERDDLPVIEIQYAGERGLVEHAVDDSAIEPERIGGRQDGADGRKGRSRGVHPEGTDESQQLADQTGGPVQRHIGQGENHEGYRVERHAVDEPAIGGH